MQARLVKRPRIITTSGNDMQARLVKRSRIVTTREFSSTPDFYNCVELAVLKDQRCKSMSIILSNACAQRPEVQELRPSTAVTFHEKIMHMSTFQQEGHPNVEYLE